eukprot:scaffold37730_cov178-Skeletonema_dohrnii-CCMP3373.AAC.4
MEGRIEAASLFRHFFMLVALAYASPHSISFPINNEGLFAVCSDRPAQYLFGMRLHNADKP